MKPFTFASAANPLDSAGTSDTSQRDGHDMLPKLLRALRTHLQMEVAFISRIEEGLRIFMHVDAVPEMQSIRVGASDPLEDGYCQRVLDGRLPQLIQDARELPEACTVPATSALPVGAHLSVPIRLRDGSVYGTFCCFSRRPNRALADEHVRLMHVLADVASGYVEHQLTQDRERAARRSRIEQALAGDALSMVYQPICEIAGGRPTGFEALARFRSTPVRPPDVWFNEAAAAGMGPLLELRAIAQALTALDHLPASVYVSCNLSADVALLDPLMRLLEQAPLHRIVVEITEHASVADYAGLVSQLKPLRERGLRLAVDDAGAGYASFRHILSLQPDLIKLDISLTRDIDRDHGRRALAAAFVGFARETGSRLVAEGVETEAELQALRALGVHKVQGYLIGRPMPLEGALQWMAKAEGEQGIGRHGT